MALEKPEVFLPELDFRKRGLQRAIDGFDGPLKEGKLPWELAYVPATLGHSKHHGPAQGNRRG